MIPMTNRLIAAAIGGIFAGLTGCAATAPPASVPGAPAADPAGAPSADIATGTPAMPADDEKTKAGGKHACASNGSCSAMDDKDKKDDKDSKKKGTMPMPMPKSGM
jgi:hypothetical protein